MWLNNMTSKKERRRKHREQARIKNNNTEFEQRERHKIIDLEKKKRENKKKLVIYGSIVIVMLILVFGIYSVKKPGIYDDFAKCLTESGAVMYGENWCQYTNGQKNMFGNSFKYVNYEVKRDLDKRPTWIIDGKTYETVQSFEKLASLTGCEEHLNI